MICEDTSQVNGPSLIFDHQMCLDISKRNIYVFGGRILTPRKIDELSTETQYSGLYVFNIGNNTWRQILVDCGHPTASHPEVKSIKSRVTHSMLFHHVSVKWANKNIVQLVLSSLLSMIPRNTGSCTSSVDSEIRSMQRISSHTMWTRRPQRSSTRII